MVVVTVVHGQLAQALAGELAGATAADVRVHTQGFVAIAHLLVALGVGEDTVKPCGGGGGGWRTHGITFSRACYGYALKFSLMTGHSDRQTATLGSRLSEGV
ncbi:hypothetical protein D3C72_2319630 [compost metagenome]